MSSATSTSTASGKNETSTGIKEALTQWIVDGLVRDVVDDISADGLLNTLLQSESASTRVESLTVQLKEKLRAHIEQEALNQLEAEFSGDLEVLNRWPEAAGAIAEPDEVVHRAVTTSEEEDAAVEAPEASEEMAEAVPNASDKGGTNTHEEPVADGVVDDAPALDATEATVSPNGKAASEAEIDVVIEDDVSPQKPSPDASDEAPDEMVDELMESFGSFPSDGEDQGESSKAVEHHTIGNEADARAQEPYEAPKASHEPTIDVDPPLDKWPDASDELKDEGEVDEATAEQTEVKEPANGTDASEAPAPTVPNTAATEVAKEDEGIFSPIKWDAEAIEEPDSETWNTDTDSLADDVLDDEAFFADAFFADDEATESVTDAGDGAAESAGEDAPAQDSLVDDATEKAVVETVSERVTSDDVLFARALIGGPADGRTSFRKTFTHDSYEVLEFAAFDVLVEAVRAQEAEANVSEAFRNVLQIVPPALTVVPLEDARPAQAQDELDEQIASAEAALTEELHAQQEQEAWHMAVLMEKEEVRRYVVDHHTPVREYLQDMRGKPQGVAQFIKKKMVEAINEEVERLSEACVEAVRTRMEDVGAEVTEIPQTKGREGDFFHLAQMVGLFADAADDVIVDMTSNLVEDFGHYGFIFRPEGPAAARHFPIIFPSSDDN